MGQHPQDTRSELISRIWSYATGMLALCIPLSVVARTGLALPATVVAGASVSTLGALVLVRDEERRTRQALVAQEQLQGLQERVATLEAIATAEHIDLQRRLRLLEQETPRDAEPFEG